MRYRGVRVRKASSARSVGATLYGAPLPLTTELARYRPSVHGHESEWPLVTDFFTLGLEGFCGSPFSAWRTVNGCCFQALPCIGRVTWL